MSNQCPRPVKNIYSLRDGEMGKGQTMILMGSLATRLPKLPHEPKLAASQRCQATLHEKNVLAGEERKMKGPNRKRAPSLQQGTKAGCWAKETQNCAAGVKHGRTQCRVHTRRSHLEGVTTHIRQLLVTLNLATEISSLQQEHMISFAFGSELLKASF